MSRHVLVLELRCPHCGERLNDERRLPLDAVVRGTGRAGVVVLSAVFGDARVETDLALESGDVLELSCPKCENGLLQPVACRLCRAPTASLSIASGGAIEFCSRVGCQARALGGFGDVDQMMALVNRMLDTPYD